MNFTNLKNLETKKNRLMISKVMLWFCLAIVLSLVFFREFWASLGTMLSPDWIFGQANAYLWGVLVMCLIWLYLKRKEVWRGMLEGSQVRRLEGWGWNFINFQTFKPLNLLGLGLVAVAVLMPSSEDFLIFQVLLASLGVFVIFFGRAARIPSLLLGIYGFAVSFPLIIERFAEEAYSRIAITPLMGLMTTLGYPLQNQGQWVHFTSSSGEPILVVITAGCAGPATMGVFLAIFTLMMLDIPLPPGKAVWIFLFGAAGTWFQSFIRLVIIMVVGYHLGEDALWTAHLWTTYILFPLWYLLFVYIYFRQAGSLPRIRGEVGAPMERATKAENLRLRSETK